MATRGIASVNYLFGMPLIPSPFLKMIVTSSFSDMRSLIPVVFGLVNYKVVLGTRKDRKGQL